MTVIVNGNLMIDEGKILWTHLAVLRLVRMCVHTSTGVLRLIRAYLGYGYGRTTLTFFFTVYYIEGAVTDKQGEETHTHLSVVSSQSP